MSIVPEMRSSVVAAAQDVAKPRRKRLGLSLPVALGLCVATSGVAIAGGLVVSEAVKDQSREMTLQPAIVAGEDSTVASVGGELRQLAYEVQSTIPYPPGMKDQMDWKQYSGGPALGGRGESRREVQLLSETRAWCLWQYYWQASMDAGNRAEASTAAAILTDVPSWPALRGQTGQRGAFHAMLTQVAEEAKTNSAPTIQQNLKTVCNEDWNPLRSK